MNVTSVNVEHVRPDCEPYSTESLHVAWWCMIAGVVVHSCVFCALSVRMREVQGVKVGTSVTLRGLDLRDVELIAGHHNVVSSE